MPTTSLPARLKRDGNINRIKELEKCDCSADDIKECFARGGITLVVRHGDIPLLENLDALERKALPVKTVKIYLSDRQEHAGLEPATA